MAPAPGIDVPAADIGEDAVPALADVDAIPAAPPAAPIRSESHRGKAAKADDASAAANKNHRGGSRTWLNRSRVSALQVVLLMTVLLFPLQHYLLSELAMAASEHST